MQLAEKQELVRLLNLYQAELLEQNRKNIENGRTEYFVHGIKYEHARIISRKLSVELGKEVKSYWDISCKVDRTDIAELLNQVDEVNRDIASDAKRNG